MLLHSFYFFTQSEFYRHRDVIDAAIVSDDETLTLYLNPLSENYNDIKNSALCKKMVDGVIDPIVLEADSMIYYADEDAGHTKEEIPEYLQKKYLCEELMVMPMHGMSVYASHEKLSGRTIL